MWLVPIPKVFLDKMPDSRLVEAMEGSRRNRQAGYDERQKHGILSSSNQYGQLPKQATNTSNLMQLLDNLETSWEEHEEGF